MESQLATCMSMKEEIGEFKPCLPLITSLRTPGMQDRHWEAISEKLGARIFPDDQFTLKVATEHHNMLEQLEVVNKIAETAAKENAIVQVSASRATLQLRARSQRLTLTLTAL